MMSFCYYKYNQTTTKIIITYASISTDSWLRVEGDGLGSSPGPIILIENFK